MLAAAVVCPCLAGAVPLGSPCVPSKTNAIFRSTSDRVQPAVAAVQQSHPCEDVHGRADACRLGSVCAQGSELVRAGGECPRAWEQSLCGEGTCVPIKLIPRALRKKEGSVSPAALSE